MIHRKGDVFTTEAAFIGHGVNLRGVMGAGIARTVRERFPNTYETYRNATCFDNTLQLGNSLLTPEDGVTIVNMATQVHPGPDARYDAIFDAAIDAASQVIEAAHDQNRSAVLAIPQIGSGIGGLDWAKVQILLEAVEILMPGFQFEVWRL